MPQVNVLPLSGARLSVSCSRRMRTCPQVAKRLRRGPGLHHYHCLNHWAWARHVILISTYQALDGAGGVIFAAAFVLIWLTSLSLAAVALRTPREHSIPEAVVASGPSE